MSNGSIVSGTTSSDNMFVSFYSQRSFILFLLYVEFCQIGIRMMDVLDSYSYFSLIGLLSWTWFYSRGYIICCLYEGVGWQQIVHHAREWMWEGLKCPSHTVAKKKSRYRSLSLLTSGWTKAHDCPRWLYTIWNIFVRTKIHQYFDFCLWNELSVFRWVNLKAVDWSCTLSVKDSLYSNIFLLTHNISAGSSFQTKRKQLSSLRYLLLWKLTATLQPYKSGLT